MARPRSRRRALLALSLVVGAAMACASGSKGDPTELRADGARTACLACHSPDYRAARHHSGETPARCLVCHEQSDWRPLATVAHPWPLTGKHAKAKCAACHEGTPPAYQDTTKACAGCHRDKWDDQHDLAADHEVCSQCHSTKAWSDWPDRPVDGASQPDAAERETEGTSAASLRPPLEPSASAKASASATTKPGLRPPPPRPRVVPTATPTGSAVPTGIGSATTGPTDTPTATPTATAAPATTASVAPSATAAPDPDVISSPSRRRPKK